MMHICRFDRRDLWTVLWVVYAAVYVHIYNKNVRLEIRKGWMLCRSVMNNFVIFFLDFY